MIKDRYETLLDIMDIEKDNKKLEQLLLLSSILSPQEYINELKENIYDCEMKFMNGDCAALAVSLDLLYGDDESSFIVIHTSRGDDEDDEEIADNEDMNDDKDRDEDYLWRLSLFGEMRHILWKDKDGQYFDILDKYTSIADSIEKSEDFYDENGMAALDVDAYEFSSNKISKKELYEKTIKGTRMSFESPLELIEIVSNSIQKKPSLMNKIKL